MPSSLISSAISKTAPSCTLTVPVKGSIHARDTLIWCSPGVAMNWPGAEPTTAPSSSTVAPPTTLRSSWSCSPETPFVWLSSAAMTRSIVVETVKGTIPCALAGRRQRADFCATTGVTCAIHLSKSIW